MSAEDAKDWGLIDEIVENRNKEDDERLTIVPRATVDGAFWRCRQLRAALVLYQGSPIC